MTILRISGAAPNILKVHHTRYLLEVVGLRLSVAKHITDDILLGRTRDIEVPSEHAAIHLKALRLLGARVDVHEADPAGDVVAA